MTRTEVKAAIGELRSFSKATPEDLNRTAVRRGISVDRLLGVSTADIRRLAKQTIPSVELANGLWASGYQEARLLGILVYPLDAIGLKQLDQWVGKIDSWGLCDQFCKRFAPHIDDVPGVAAKWANSKTIYTRRASLALIANRCMRAEDLPEADLEEFGQLIIHTSTDERAHVKQACCWALRELGKMNETAHDYAIGVALDLMESADRTSAWVGACAYRELETLVKVPERRRLLSSKSKTASKLSRRPSRKRSR